MPMRAYRVEPGSEVDLARCDPKATGTFPDGKAEARKLLDKLNDRLEELQERLYAGSRHRVLVVLQALDTGGKDGTIRHVFEGVDPLGVRVASFKAPAPEELTHDYLWRVHQKVPACGEIVIFNRSHYEDVLVVRVKQLVPEAVWRKRYEQINAFERMLADEGTTILKFYLHISRDEQKKRLEDRRREKPWKFNPEDVAERARWDDYMRAYEDALGRTSTEWAPWYVIPADRKWYRDLVVSRILVDRLEQLDMRYPEPAAGLDDIVID